MALTAAVPVGLKLPSAVAARLRCPVCGGSLQCAGNGLQCAAAGCGASFPVVDGVPLLLNEQSSLFSADEAIRHRTRFTRSAETGLKAAINRLIPSISANVKARTNYAHLARLLVEQAPTPRVLIVGCGEQGEGLEMLLAQPGIEVVASDVVLSPAAMVVCDAHDLPFDDETFDAVVAQAVLEYVLDPFRCANEFHRVLTPRGLIYAETPFMQQVHGGPYDFMRFTHLGHRRLFRWFEEVDSGVVCGPGMALAWAYQYFLWSFVHSRAARKLLQAWVGFTAFWLKYLDRWLADRPAALDAASGYYFLGRKSDVPLSDRALISLYRGALR